MSAESTYEPGTTDFYPSWPGLSSNPDLIGTFGVTPADAPLLIRTARELGYQGILSTETAQDIKILKEVAGELANGFISVGGASTPEIRTRTWRSSSRTTIRVAGEWNDEAGTKVYALEMILATLQRRAPEAIEDIEVYKAAIPRSASPIHVHHRPEQPPDVGQNPTSTRTPDRCPWS